MSLPHSMALLLKKRSAFIFGLMVGVLLPSSTHLQQLVVETETLRFMFRTQLESVFDPSMLGNITQYFISSVIPSPALRDPGQTLMEEGLRVHHPVVMVPGIVSTSLESWGRQGCAGQLYFRRKIWGDLAMGTSFLQDKECWMKSLMLDPETGLDPSDGSAKLRAAQGIDAAEYFIPGYWVWAKLIENFAYLGYDPNTLSMAAYDWRLSPQALEKRDHFFSQLKTTLELAQRRSGRKAVLIAHSMGCNVVHYFLKWVESARHGGQRGWVQAHLHAVVHLGPPFLGTAKSVPSLLSGEMRDTAHMGWAMAYLLERFLSRPERAKLFQTWSSVGSMLPKGGSAIWGGPKGTADFLKLREDSSCSNSSSSVPLRRSSLFPLITFRSAVSESNSSSAFASNITGSTLHEFIFQHTSTAFRKQFDESYSYGVARGDLDSARYDQDKFWTNPLESALPHAPQLTVYSFYGVGKATERAYFYARGTSEQTLTFHDRSSVPSAPPLSNSSSSSSPHTEPLSSFSVGSQTPVTIVDRVRGLFLDTVYSNPDEDVTAGVQDADGDGTVTLLSLGYMSSHGWRWPSNEQPPLNFTDSRLLKKFHGPLFNPGRVKVVTREYKHQPSSVVSDIRGGPRTADHIDLLGNHELIEDVLRIAAGQLTDQSQDRFFSSIREMSDRVELFP